MSLGLSLAGLHHFTGRPCLRSAPTWDALFEIVLPVGMGLVALSALGWGVVRLVLMARILTRRGILADPDLQALADSLAQRLGTPGPCVRLCASDRPLALTYGMVRPTVLLSTWMVEH